MFEFVSETLKYQELSYSRVRTFPESCKYTLYAQKLSCETLFFRLARVYVETTADVKRSILRYVETPVRNMGMDSPELLKLLDTFPKGAETIITKIIHILTDKSSYKTYFSSHEKF